MTALGVAVGRGTIRAVLRQGSRVLWAGETRWDAPTDLAPALSALVAEIPKQPRRVGVVLERDVLQVRTAPSDLDPLDPDALHRLLRRNGAPLVAAACRTGRRGAWCVVAADDGLLETVLHATHTAGWSVRTIGAGPEAVLRALRITSGRVVLAGDRGWYVIEGARGRLTSARWVLTCVHGHRPASAPPALASSGDAPERLLAAYGATVGPLRLRLVRAVDRRDGQRRARRHLVRAAVAALSGWLFAGGAFAARTTRERAGIARELDALRPSLEEAQAVRREVQAVLRLVTAVAEARAAPSALDRLGRLTEALPDSVTLTALEFRANGDVFAAGVGRQAAQAVATLGRVPDLADVRLSGTVTRSDRGGVGWERFTVTARWQTPP